jgi:hypothetical protein
MNLRTTFKTEPSEEKITYDTGVMFIGSCFASEIGSVMSDAKMKVMVNPAGTVYNPVSAGSTIDNVLENKKFTPADLYIYKGINLSFSHYTDFSSENQDIALEKINKSAGEAHSFLKDAGFLFVTFGTARIFRFRETGRVVSNCHKLPDSMFTRELLSVEEIVQGWEALLDKLALFNKNIRVIFTISPVRHWKDGAHGNQVSKSVLFLAVENLLKHPAVQGYFPAYELLMDDLRDYRFYDDDMLHPSKAAIDYIQKAFSECYFDAETLALKDDLLSIKKAMNHRFLTDSMSGKKEFAANILRKIAQLEKKKSGIDLSREKSYFQNITNL